ncbi:MAG: ribonuclease HII [Candidatus Diapherotrites archaeon]|nr:ribonuclease HII [Candidatus Diapherotrites archaeon]
MLIAGIDEAGRGPVLGPLVLCVTTIAKEKEAELQEIGVKDSKLLSAGKREEMFPAIKSCVHEFQVAVVTPHELNHLMAVRSLNEIEAMKAAGLLNGLQSKPNIVYADSPDPLSHYFGERIRKYLAYSPLIFAEHKADLNYPIVSAASILAKVTRDEHLRKLSEEFGEMGSGYPHDPKTMEFLRAYVKTHSRLPEFARAHWQTAANVLDEQFQQKLV